MDLKNTIGEEAAHAIRDKVFPGCVVGIVYTSGERHVLPFGRFTYDSESPMVKDSTIYDTASLTKAIPTNSLALQLIEKGMLHMTDRLIDYVPEFKNTDRETVRIKHLLTCTIDGYGLASAIDGADGRSLPKRTAADFLHVLLTHDFLKRPGEVFTYSNIPAALLGLVVEKVTGRTIDALAGESFFNPLNMTRSTFYPETFSTEEVAPTEHDAWRGVVQGVVHDESAYICKKEGKIVGHAGLFSTVPDLLNFLEMLLHKGTFSGKTYFQEKTVADMGTNQIPELNASTGLGWELNQPSYMGAYCTPHTFGKTGFTGTLLVCDVEKGVGYVVLSNRTFPKRPRDSVSIHTFRKKLGEILLA